MRNAFADEITKLSAFDQRIVLLSGDIGNKLFDNFKRLYPSRFYNCGIAEANMTSMAAGLAMNGFKPITYTITPFNTIRCLEQIKLDVCYHNLPILIVGVGSGLSYSSLGVSHSSCDDIAFLKNFPNITITSPADAFEIRSILREALKLNSPVYLRMGKKGEPLIYKKIPDIQIGKGKILENGNDLCLISTGNMLFETYKVKKLLQKQDINAQIVNIHTIKPLDLQLLSNIFQNFDLVASIEEHNLISGLGSSIAELMIDNSFKSKLLRFGIKDEFAPFAGDQSFIRNYYSLNAESISKIILKNLKKMDI